MSAGGNLPFKSIFPSAPMCPSSSCGRLHSNSTKNRSLCQERQDQRIKAQLPPESPPALAKRRLQEDVQPSFSAGVFSGLSRYWLRSRLPVSTRSIGRRHRQLLKSPD